MRVALVSPYSWTYPGGVTRHIEALAERFFAEGHDVRVLAPYDPDDRLLGVLHRGAAPQPRPLPDYLIPLGRTIGFRPTARSRTCPRAPRGISQMRRELRSGGYDVVHLHEPVVPMTVLGRAARPRACRSSAPSTATRRTASRTTSPTCSARAACSTTCTCAIAVSEAAAWTAQRFYGGRYRVVPNGVGRAGRRRARRCDVRRTGPCGSRSSARRSSARACRCCCARSRRCASTSPSS